MGALSDRQLTLVRSLPAEQRNARIAGVLLTLMGIAYMAWSFTRFDIGVDPARNIGFDAPVTKPVATIFDARRKGLDLFGPTTRREEFLIHRQILGMNFSGALLLLGFRMTLGLLPLMLGLSTLTVVIERARLLHIVAALDDTSGAAIIQS